MKKFKLFALAVFAMLSTNAMAAYVEGDAQVGQSFIVDGIEYQVTAKYVPGDGALTPEAIGQVTVIRYANSTLTTAVTIPSQVQSLDVEGTINPAYKYSVVGIDGNEDYPVVLGTGGVYKVNTTTPHKPFANCAATSVTLPATVMFIGDGAFDGFKGSSVVIPLGSTLSVIGAGAFAKATALETFDTNNAKYLSQIGFDAFVGCAKLTSITLGDELISIGAGAFKGTGITTLDLSSCKKFTNANGAVVARWFTDDAAAPNNQYNVNETLTTVILPTALKTPATDFLTIAADAFNGCTALATLGATANSFVIPAYIKGIAAVAAAAEQYETDPAPILAADWAADEDHVEGTEVGQWKLIDGYYKKIKSLAVEAADAVPAIGDGAFVQTAITKIDLSGNANINAIGDWFSKFVSATNNKSTLKQVVLKANVGYTIGGNLAKITSLEKVGTADAEYQLTAGTFLAEGMFAKTKLGQLDLSKVEVPELPALFGADGISSLTAVTLNNGTTSIAVGAFAKCVALETLDVKMANGTAKDLKAIVSVGNGAFYRTKLSSLTFGAALKTFVQPWGEFVQADGDMTLATAITLDLSAATLLNGSEAVAAAAEQYETDPAPILAADWAADEDHVEGTEVGQWKLIDGYYKKIKSLAVEAADAVPANIPANAFKKLAALTSINLPSTLATIGANAFEGTGITSIELPNGFQQKTGELAAGIGAAAFKDSKLAEMTFYPEVATSTIFANDNVFSGCSMVKIYTTEAFAKVGGPDQTSEATKKVAPTFSQWVTSSPEEVTTVKDKVKKQAMKGFIAKSAFAFNSAECVVYEAYFDGDDIVMSPLRKISGKYNVPANTAVIVRTAEEATLSPEPITGEFTSSMVYGQLEKTVANPNGLNQLRSTYYTVDETTKVWDELSRAQVYKNYMYVLVNNATYGFSFQHFTGSKIKKGNIYVINPDKAPSASGRLNIVWKDENGNVVEDEATAIQSIEAAEAENGAIYNLQGVRVNAAKKGLYIKNGKKYIVK